MIDFDLWEKLGHSQKIKLLNPLGYLDFIKLIMEARVVITDSGGIQEETTVLNVPCLTMREETERPITVSVGTNKIIGTDHSTVISEFYNCLKNPKKGVVPEFWDGKSAQRIARIISNIKS